LFEESLRRRGKSEFGNLADLGSDAHNVLKTQYRKSCYELSIGGNAFQRCANCLS
jgi:hypothetical protein